MSADQLLLPEPPCELNACRICTGCAHSHHDACRSTVRCPTDGVVRQCACCEAAS